jgi:transposase
MPRKFYHTLFLYNRLFSSEKIALCIYIFSPFWKTPWFLILITCLIGTVFYLFFKIHVLACNEDIIRELLRLAVRIIKRREKYFSFKERGKEIRIKTDNILYVKSSGNYIDVVTLSKTYTIRGKVSSFISMIPDSLEFLRIHRSYIIRIDKVEQKTKKSVFINREELPAGETYIHELDKIFF